MEKKLKKKIKDLFSSKDTEMWDLARVLFWNADPSLEDFEYALGARYSSDREAWEKAKIRCKKEYCEKEE